MTSVHLAFDLGASSGRAIIGLLDGSPQKLTLEEVHRFEHGGVPTPVGPVWDLTGIWRNMLIGLEAAGRWCRQHNLKLDTLGVDTWGVDWTLVGPGGEVLGFPHCYRDPANEGYAEQVLERVGGYQQLYARTGIQRMPFNSIFPLYGRWQAEPGMFAAGSRLLFLPDLLHYWLSGEIITESSIASTSSMLDVQTGDWDVELIESLGIPTSILGAIVEPGTKIGPLRRELAELAHLEETVQVVTPAAHDTASAIAAVPVDSRRGPHWAYVSSGTWSCMGAELQRPLATPEAAVVPFTNERGIGGTIRFLKNIAGLWLIQELRREWQAAGQEYSFADLVEQANQAEPLRTIVDPNFSEFASPGDMAGKLQRYAERTGQPIPTSTGQLVRTCLESLALSYRHTCDKLEQLTGTRVEVLHVVGGGSQNKLLNQMTAEALARPVVCGPVEATAIGNLLVQGMSHGAVTDLADLREIVARSVEPETYQPSEPAEVWERAQQCFASVVTQIP